ncbi:MAG: GMC family oxidoreductase [Parvularculaceae bacterium]
MTPPGCGFSAARPTTGRAGAGRWSARISNRAPTGRKAAGRSGDALAPYYSRAAQTCELGPARFDDLAFWRAQPGGEAAAALAFDPGRLRTSVIQISKPTRFGEAYGDEARGAANIRVIANAALRELVPAAETRPETARKRIAGAEIQSNAGHRFSIHARRIVLAAGGLETPRLMLLSQRVHPAGAGNERGLVGRYFMDHIWIPHAAYLQFAQEGVDLPFYFDELEAAGARLFSVLTPNAENARREGLGGFRLWLRPSRRATPGADALREIAADFGDRRFPDDFGRHLGAMLTDFGSVADVAYKTLFGRKTSPFINNDPDAPIRGAYVDLNLEQRPNADSRITLDDARDGFGQRRIRLDWRLSEDDWRTALGACRLVAEEAGRIGLGRVRIALDGGGPSWPDETTGSRHHMGATRMSDDPRNGVVDSNLRVHTTDNLYIASSSVFPTSGYANPTLTIVALAHRLADHLKATTP